MPEVVRLPAALGLAEVRQPSGGAREAHPVEPELAGPPLPPVLWGLDLERQLTLRQWMGADCVLCARWLGRRLGERSRVLATVRGCELRACAPACGGRS